MSDSARFDIQINFRDVNIKYGILLQWMQQSRHLLWRSANTLKRMNNEARIRCQISDSYHRQLIIIIMLRKSSTARCLARGEGRSSIGPPGGQDIKLWLIFAYKHIQPRHTTPGPPLIGHWVTILASDWPRVTLCRPGAVCGEEIALDSPWLCSKMFYLCSQVVIIWFTDFWCRAVWITFPFQCRYWKVF